MGPPEVGSREYIILYLEVLITNTARKQYREIGKTIKNQKSKI